MGTLTPKGPPIASSNRRKGKAAKIRAEAIEVPDPKVTPQERDGKLGNYMSSFSQLELALQLLFEKLLDTNRTAALIVARNAGGPKVIREMISALGRDRLKASDFEVMEKLLDRAKTCASIRNNIVHGAWQLVIRVNRHDDGSETGRVAKWTRWYQPSDPALLDQMMGPDGDKRLLAKHQFSLSAIDQHSTHTVNLSRDFDAFVDRVRLEPYQHRQPATSLTQAD
jgi:hypothetical protein